jgi:hypothetical protein
MNKLKIHLKTSFFLIIMIGCSILLSIGIIKLGQLIQSVIVYIFQYITIEQLITYFIILIIIITIYNTIYKLLSEKE